MEIVNELWSMIAIFGAIIAVKIMLPKISYYYKLSLVIASIGAFYFAASFLSSLSDEESSSASYFIFMCVWLFYIYKGSKTVAYKTMSGVFSRITKEPIGSMYAGSLKNWADPVFEIVTTSVDGIPNKSADLQRFEMSMPETAMIQTQKRGIQAKVKTISLMLELIPGKIEELLKIEGGLETVKGRIHHFIDEFFLEEIPKITPETLDQDKADTIQKLREGLEGFVNDHCLHSNYPYIVVNHSVIIGDTELETKYYEALSKKEYTQLEQDAKDTEAKALRERIAAFGNHILPRGSKKEKIDAALIAMSIVKKDIQEKKFAVDSDLAELALDIAKYFKKNP